MNIKVEGLHIMHTNSAILKYSNFTQTVPMMNINLSLIRPY